MEIKKPHPYCKLFKKYHIGRFKTIGIAPLDDPWCFEPKKIKERV
jgi:hypothetical protein